MECKEVSYFLLEGELVMDYHDTKTENYSVKCIIKLEIVVCGCLGLLEVVSSHSKPLGHDRRRNGINIA